MPRHVPFTNPTEIIEFQTLGCVAEWFYAAIAKRTGGSEDYGARIQFGAIQVANEHDRTIAFSSRALWGFSSRITIQAPSEYQSYMVRVKFEQPSGNNKKDWTMSVHNKVITPYADGEVHLALAELEVIADRLTGKIWGA